MLLSIALTGAMQMLLCFVELIVVGWFYGEARLQQDIKFMTGAALEEWKLFILRFISPLLALFAAVSRKIQTGWSQFNNRVNSQFDSAFIWQLLPLVA